MNKKQLAKKAARIAALAAYDAIMNAPTKKIASSNGSFDVANANDIAKTAAVSAYRAVLKVAQPVSKEELHKAMQQSTKAQSTSDPALKQKMERDNYYTYFIQKGLSPQEAERRVAEIFDEPKKEQAAKPMSSAPGSVVVTDQSGLQRRDLQTKPDSAVSKSDRVHYQAR